MGRRVRNPIKSLDKMQARLDRLYKKRTKTARKSDKTRKEWGIISE